VLHARVTLRNLPDPALERPAIAKASLDVSGRVVRTHATAPTIAQALALLEERLRQSLEHLEETRRARRRRTAAVEPGEWRRGDPNARRPEPISGPTDEEALVRRKTYAIAALTPEEAVVEMDSLDQDFHLFTNADTGEESVVYRRPDDGIGLLCARPIEAPFPETPLRPDPAPAPVLVLQAATEALNVSGERFLFFVDAQSGRGNVLYRRDDGHYGLIEPTDKTSDRR